MPEPMRTKGNRYIEMTTAEWIGRLLMPVDTFPNELKEGCGEILKLRKEKEIKSAVEWLRNRMNDAKWKEPVSELAKVHNGAMNDCISFVKEAFEDVVSKI